MTIKDDKTPRLGLPLPFVDNFLEDDVERLKEALNVLDSAVLVDDSGKIPAVQLPDVAITDIFPVSSEDAMLALDAQPGDFAIRDDVSKSFILMEAPPSTRENWKELLNDALDQLAKPDGYQRVGGLDKNYGSIKNTREIWRRTLAEAGLTLVTGSFEDGATASSKNDAVWHVTGGQCYVWGGTFPKSVPANSTPGSAGGTGVGAWSDVKNTTLRSDFAKPSGARLVYEQGGVTVQDKLDELSSAAMSDSAALYRYKLVRKLPINPPLVASVVSSNGYSYLYPQAFSYGRNGDIFINLSSNGGIATWVAKYNSAGEIVSIFNAFAGTSEVSHFFSEGGVDYYVIGGKGVLHKYNVTNLPVGVSSQTPVSTMSADVNFGGCGFDGKNRMLLEEQAQPLGKLSIRNRLFVYNMLSGLREQTITLPFQIVGAYTSSAYENIIHKTQAFAVGKGGVYLAHGKNSTGAEEDVVHATGVSFCNWQGNASATGLITARAMKEFLIGQGLPANRIECEGIAMSQDGFPHILHAYLQSTSDPAAQTEGIAISSIGEPFGYTDLSAGAIAPITATNYGKSKDGLVNPYTGEVMDTMTKILDYMAATDTQEYSFWTGTVTVTDLDGAAFPAFTKVKIYNQNGYSFFYQTINSNTQAWWIATGSPYTKTYINFVGDGGKAGSSNTIAGLSAGRKITTGAANVIYGRLAGEDLTTGSGNVFIGPGVFGKATTCDQSVGVGLNAGRWQLDGVTPSNFSYCTALGVGSVLSGNSQVQLGGPTATPYAYAALQIRSDERDKTDFREITSEIAEAFVLGLVSYFYKLDLRDDYYGETIEQVGVDEEGQPIYESVRHAIPKDGSKVRNRDHAGYSAQKTKALMDALGIDFGLYQDHLVNGGGDVKTLAYEQSIPLISKALADEIRRGKERDKRIAELEKRLAKLDGQ